VPITELEKEMLVFFLKGNESLIGHKNISRSKHLIQNYRTLIESIEEFKYPAVLILNGNMNRFYDLCLRALSSRLDLNDSNLWQDLDYLLEIITLLESHINSINNSSLWKKFKIMEQEDAKMRLLFSLKDLNKIKEYRLELEKITGVFKIEIVKEYFQQKLVEVLLKKETIENFDIILQMLLSTKITNRNQKDDFIFELQLKCLAKKTNPSSTKIGFIEKYKQKLDQSDLNDKSEYSAILKTIFLNEKRFDNESLICILDEFVYLLESCESMSFYSLLNIYKVLTRAPKLKIISDLMFQLEFILSKQLEQFLNLNAAETSSKELTALLKIVLNERTKGVVDFNELIERKSAFYAKLIKLELNKNVKKSCILLSYVKGQINPNDKSSKDFNNNEKSMLNKSFKINSNELSSCDVFEQVVFGLSELIYEMNFVILVDQDIDSNEKQKKIEDNQADLKSKLESIKNIKSIHAVIKGLKTWVNFLEDQQKRSNDRLKIMKQIKPGNENNFLNEVTLQTNAYKQEEMLIIINESLDEAFGSDWLKRKDFILTAVKTFESRGQKDITSHSLFRKLIDLIDFNELIGKEMYVEMLVCLQQIESLNGDNGNKLRLKVEKQYIDLVSRVLKEIQLIKDSSLDQNVLLAANITTEAVKQIQKSSEMSTQNFKFLKSLFEIFRSYSLKLKDLVQIVRKEEAEKKQIMISQDFQRILKELFELNLSSFLKNDGNDFVYSVLNHLENSDPSETFLRYFIHYFNLRVSLDWPSLDKEKIETKFKVLLRSCGKKIESDSSNKIYNLLENVSITFDSGYFYQLIKETEQFFGRLEELKKQCEETKMYLIDRYVSKLDAKDKLTIKGRANFIKELIAKMHNIKNKGLY